MSGASRVTKPTILEQGTAILKDQPDNSLQAGVDRQGVEAGVKKRLGRGWSLLAWVRRKWTGEPAEAGAAVQKRW